MALASVQAAVRLAKQSTAIPAKKRVEHILHDLVMMVMRTEASGGWQHTSIDGCSRERNTYAPLASSM
jgi:hypothetical protein